MRNPEHAQARIIYVEDEFDASVETVYATFEAQLGAKVGTTLAREADALLTVKWPMPADFAELETQQTVLTLTFERSGAATKVTLTHAGFGRGAAWDKALGYYTQGWPSVLAQIKHSIANAGSAVRLAA